MNATVAVRQMKLSDTDNLRQITHTSFSRFFREIATMSQYSEAQVLVSEKQGKAVGFVKLVKFHVKGGKFGCILGVAVLPQFRRKALPLTL